MQAPGFLSNPLPIAVRAPIFLSSPHERPHGTRRIHSAMRRVPGMMLSVASPHVDLDAKCLATLGIMQVEPNKTRMGARFAKHLSPKIYMRARVAKQPTVELTRGLAPLSTSLPNPARFGLIMPARLCERVRESPSPRCRQGDSHDTFPKHPLPLASGIPTLTGFARGTRGGQRHPGRNAGPGRTRRTLHSLDALPLPHGTPAPPAEQVLRPWNDDATAQPPPVPDP